MALGTVAMTETTTEMATEITTVIHDRTGGRLTHVCVTVAANVVTISAVAPSFDLKQLALEAARAALRLALEIALHAD